MPIPFAQTPRPRRTTWMTAALLSATVLLPGAARAQGHLGARDSLALRADSVFQRFDRTDSPGCALGVYEQGRIRYARGYGMASLEHGIALSPRSVLDVGSISKQFTAMAILLLEQDGRLSLDDPLRTHLPELPPYTGGITLRRALSQTSGLRDIYVLMDQTGRAFEGDSIDALRLIGRQRAPNYAPGERYLYTNSGWLLAAQVVYRLTGKSLGAFADERIFAPLGMRDTRYLSDATLVIPGLATGYAPRAGGGFRVARSAFDGSIMGAGGVHTTIEDFGRWLANYHGATVGGRRILEVMTTATALTSGAPAASGLTQAYAVGLNVGTLNGVRVVSHGGSWAGYRGHFLLFPDHGVAVATFCNLTTAGPDTLARKVAGIYLGDRMAPDTALAWSAALAAAPKATMPVESLAPLAGVWRNAARGEVRRTRLAGDTLFLVGATRMRVEPLEGGRFRAGPGTELRFDGGAPGGPARVSIRTLGDTATYVRVDSAVATPAYLAAFVGTYHSDEVESLHEWRLEKDTLVLYADHRRQGVLDPASRDLFTRGGTVYEIERDGRGRITGYRIQAGRVRDLRFMRVAGSTTPPP
jgi:CubicO group peptidase (beta-lactamase class C family)